ncbi:MAG: hypothetical protein LW724_19680 [Planctomycetaceae bacterium]|nr:hypothetical protein [Planctomycetaceae bacterium]
MTTQKEGIDPVAGLYNRAIVDLMDIYNCDKHEPLPGTQSPDDRGPKAEECWALFDRLMETYRASFIRFDESRKLYRHARQQPQVAELISRTRARQLRYPYIDLLRGLVPVEGTRTIEAYYDKVDECGAMWKKFGFTSEENEAIPGLIENLQTEFALIEANRKHTFTAVEQAPPKEQQATPAAVDPKSAGPKRARWTQLEKDVHKLNEMRKPTKVILNALRPQYPDLTWEMVRSICNRNSKGTR